MILAHYEADVRAGVWARSWRVRVLLVVVFALSPACLPIPRTVRLAPELQGTVTDGERPLQGQRLALDYQSSADSVCTSRVTASTDSLGRFRMPSPTKFSLVVWLLPIHFYRSWRICDAQGHTIWKNYSYGPENAPKQEILVCRTDAVAPPRPLMCSAVTFTDTVGSAKN